MKIIQGELIHMSGIKVNIIHIGLLKEAWGPRFWRILHTFAECSGSQTNPILESDEAEAWIVLLKSQTFVMPCAICKTHFLEYQKSYRIEKIRNEKGLHRRAFLRQWVWNCHKHVNEMNTKESPELEELELLYPKKSIEKELSELSTMFQQAMTTQQLKPDDVRRWKQVVARLRIMYGV
jgi:hypothetical protein